ncbi:uncharacterized protein J3D65DRAFT_602930 [Phyllosticta citribraziliensis]|uniref:Uncharacterized protein n=1 Tax=Phyllosticta citribraziliensis TaxID=989973 RepID=A0ABR1LNX4_9PEZI
MLFYTRYVKTVLPIELQHFSPYVPSEEAAVVCYAMVYLLADKYQAMHVKVHLAGAVTMRLEAASVKLKSNRPGAISIASFVHVANTVFTTMPDSEQTLRNLIYCYMKKHFKLLMDTAQFHAEINGVDGF